MPHCIIEYSNNLENYITPIELINKVYKGAFKSNLFKEDDIKIRAIAYKHYQTGNKKISFIHIYPFQTIIHHNSKLERGKM